MYKGEKESRKSKNKFMSENLEQAHNQIIKHVERKKKRKRTYRPSLIHSKFIKWRAIYPEVSSNGSHIQYKSVTYFKALSMKKHLKKMGKRILDIIEELKSTRSLWRRHLIIGRFL